MTSCRALLALFALLVALAPGAVRADLIEVIPKIKPSIVVVGAMLRTPSPHFELHGTGFVVGDGTLVATNAHVASSVTAIDGAALGIQARPAGEVQLRKASVAVLDTEHDLALLRLDGPPLPALPLGDSEAVREGQAVGFTGFPIGGVLGFAPVTHRGMVAAITPIALPQSTARQLSPQAIRRMRDGNTFRIFQLDATAYPGNSGSPVFDATTGAVVGIINMVLVKSAKESALTQPSGISYAIPANFLGNLLRN